MKCSPHFEVYDSIQSRSRGLQWTYLSRPQPSHFSFLRCSYSFMSFNGLWQPACNRISLRNLDCQQMTAAMDTRFKLCDDTGQRVS